MSHPFQFTMKLVPIIRNPIRGDELDFEKAEALEKGWANEITQRGRLLAAYGALMEVRFYADGRRQNYARWSKK